MRRRLVTTLLGGLVGAAVAPLLSSALELDGMVAMGACALAGLVIGYVGGMLFDAFTSDFSNFGDTPTQE